MVGIKHDSAEMTTVEIAAAEDWLFGVKERVCIQ